MTRHTLAAAFFAGLAILTGCESCPFEDPCAIRAGEGSVVTDEIDAAGRLNFDPAKSDALGAIAGRPTLEPREQEHLVCVTLHRVKFDPAKQDILRTLIHNPSFSPQAKSAILRNLELVKYDPARAELIHEMEGRGDKEKPGHES